MTNATPDLYVCALDMLRASKKMMACINELPGGREALMEIGFDTSANVQRMIKDLLSSGLNQTELGEIIGVSQVRVNQLVHEGGSVSYERGLRLKARHDAWLQQTTAEGVSHD